MRRNLLRMCLITASAQVYNVPLFIDCNDSEYFIAILGNEYNIKHENTYIKCGTQ